MNTHIAIVTSVLMLTACTPSNRDDSTAEPAQLADAGTTTGTISIFGGMSAENTSAMPGGAHAGDQAVAGQATSADTDTGQGDLGGASSLSDQEELEQPSMVITDSELVDIPIDLWMQGVPSPDRDPLVYRYDAGNLQWPQANPDGDDDGVRWFEKTVDDDGNITDFFGADGYLLAKFPIAPDERLVARCDRCSQMWTTFGNQPGDFYGSGTTLMPMATEGPEGVIAVRVIPRRGAPKVRLFKTSDEVVFNTADSTLPDLRVGQKDPLPLGMAVLNLRKRPLIRVRAKVVENQFFEASSVEIPGIAAGAVTQLPFQLIPKQAFQTIDEDVTVILRVESPTLQNAYERTVTRTVIAQTQTFRQTFISPIDGSVQYYGVVPPTEVVAGASYAAVLSLHGASVEAINQAKSYSQKAWTYVFAPTNRRPFGFDWEEWGRLNALAALDHGIETFKIDPTKVYLTGHSMGGHGTWHVGVTTPGRFATLSPSAGWESFYSYGGSRRPTGPLSRSRAHSDTLVYLTNLAQRGIYILHGDADDNVPVSEGRKMNEEIRRVAMDVEYFEQPDVGHWWDGEESAGVDCVDWPPMFAFMQDRRLDPVELDFEFLSPSPSYAGEHSFITLESAQSPDADIRVTSQRIDNRVRITTDNMRAMTIDGAALTAKGISTIEIDGDTIAVENGQMTVGPLTGKRSAVYGPFNQAFRKPFCFIYPDDHSAYTKVVGYLVSYWSMIGNGHACTLPESELTEEVKQAWNLIRMGETADEIMPDGFERTNAGITLNGALTANAGLLFVQPEGDRLSAGWMTNPGQEALIKDIVPFSSRAGWPDYLIWSARSLAAAGFFDNDWALDNDP